MVSQPAHLKREHSALVVEQGASRGRVPFEDIATLVLNHRDISLTHAVLSACAEHGVALYCCGDNHQPNGVLLAYQQHSRATGRLRQQLALDKPTTKQAWSRIIQAKIDNQAACLAHLRLDGAERLSAMARQIRSGDPDNLEAQASALYFVRLLGPDFTRAQDRWANAALNYGYAVLRGACARAVVSHGLNPSLGLFHHSEQNAFNLADDLLEPFRPLVDLHVASHPAADPLAPLSPADKVALVSLLNTDLRMPRGRMSALSAIDQAAASLWRVYGGAGAPTLELPELDGLHPHQPHD